MQEEIRLEQFNETRRAQLEAVEAENREKQLVKTQRILSRHWDTYIENVRNCEEEENVGPLKFLTLCLFLSHQKLIPCAFTNIL